MRRLARCALLLLLASVGCQKARETHNFSHLQMRGEPLVDIAADPSAATEDLKTFCFASPPSGRDPTQYALLAWLVADNLELFGYREVKPPDKANAVILLDFVNPQVSVTTPPTTGLIPWPEPGRWVTSSGGWTGTIGSTPTRGQTHSSTWVPGYWTAIPYVRPGRVETFYHPGVGMAVYRAADLTAGEGDPAPIWRGRCVATSTNPNFGVTGQFGAAVLALRFIGRCGPPTSVATSSGWLGISLVASTPDGSTVWPVVTGTYRGSPAERSGLQQFDILAAVDGKSTANRRTAEVVTWIGGEPGAKRRLTVWRLDRSFDVDLTLVSRPPSPPAAAIP